MFVFQVVSLLASLQLRTLTVPGTLTYVRLRVLRFGARPDLTGVALECLRSREIGGNLHKNSNIIINGAK
jgi:hypothetical protein